MSITALLSTADGEDQPVDLHTWRARRIRKDELLWVDAVAPDDEESALLRSALRLSDATTERLQLDGEEARPEAVVHDDAIEVVVLALGDDENAGRDPIPLRILAGAGWVITTHPESIPILEEHRARIQDQREVGRLRPIELVVSVLDWNVEGFFRAAARLEAEVDKLDDAALRTGRDLLDRLVAMRRRIARVRRVLTPQREVLAEMTQPDFLPESARHASDEIVAVSARLERAAEAIANAREMLIGTFDVHMTRTAQRTNDTMRLLTLASVVLLPSVVLAGIMGMNFKVGLFDNPNLFWVVIALMIFMAAVTLGVARWRGWL